VKHKRRPPGRLRAGGRAPPAAARLCALPDGHVERLRAYIAVIGGLP